MKSASEKRMSEVLMEFASPLLNAPDVQPTKANFENAILIASVVWNAVVIDAVHSGSEHVTQVCAGMARRGAPDGVIPALVQRKKDLFGNVTKLIVCHELALKNGKPVLKVTSLDSSNTKEVENISQKMLTFMA